jgi:hypothetical protein
LLPRGSPARSSAPRDVHLRRRVPRGLARTAHVEPYAGDPLSFRLFTVEADCWHRLYLLEPDATKKAIYGEEARERYLNAVNQEALADLLGRQGETQVWNEVLILIDRGREHMVNVKPLADAMRLYLPDLELEISRVPASLKALYAAYLPAAKIDLGLSLHDLRRQGMLASRPRETDLTLADVYYLTHEIYAHTDYAAIPLSPSPEEAAYLLRVLPFYTLFYANLNNLDIMAELASCLHAVGMRDTYAYQEAIRVLVERQNPDGSFGLIDPRGRERPPEPREYLHATMNALWALRLDLLR